MVRNSFARMANFLGQNITADNKLVLSDPAGHQNRLDHPNNNLRITRILECLSFLGMNAEYESFLQYLTTTAETHVALGFSA